MCCWALFSVWTLAGTDVHTVSGFGESLLRLSSLCWLWLSEVVRFKGTEDPAFRGNKDNGSPCQDVATGSFDDCCWAFVIKYLHTENVSVATHLLFQNILVKVRSHWVVTPQWAEESRQRREQLKASNSSSDSALMTWNLLHLSWNPYLLQPQTWYFCKSKPKSLPVSGWITKQIDVPTSYGVCYSSEGMDWAGMGSWKLEGEHMERSQ